MKIRFILCLASSVFLMRCTSNNSDENLEIAEKAWITLFDGESTDQLRGYGIKEFPTGVWLVENGMLVTNPDTANRDLVTKERFEDFELEYSWAVDTAANSGVFIHVQETKAMEAGNGNSPNWLENWEFQILDDLHFYDTVAVRSAGSLYDLIIPENKELKPIGEFNKAKILHKDGHVEHWLNGQKVVEFEIGSKEMNELLSNSKFSENPNFGKDTEGHIMFQHHGQRVYLKDIRVREI
ncbi:3-keto-disaccharide hydrolase [Jiulongibacter sp. NS-SX5]|uniref:3-keto-disaccharide hydrolase n=1 Tax=Jiulongibacter sp. NS-SX5 TaxID=3463854 RepID=UPI004058344E